ncbi:MAG: inositol monophosphatase [Spirochaetae bacterium HGW-Spirochaetae-4]|nr:MAG: inositol monophosphatase [Spirochaetae bacterium HGW-Spirochaetae-4]
MERCQRSGIAKQEQVKGTDGMENRGIERRLQAAIEAARLAGSLLVAGPSDGLRTETKGKSDFVTAMDLASEKMVKSYLHERFPKDNFLGEETGYEHHGDGGTWVIDPIDGTTNYIHGLFGYTISIAYEEKSHEPLLGVVYVPQIQELFHAIQGGGAFCQGVAIRCSEESVPGDAVAIVSPPMRYPARMPQYFNLYEHICPLIGELRDYGSAALHMCLVAAGRAEAFIEFGLKYHDIAAGTVILQEAGGRVAPIEQDTEGWTGDIIATNGKLHQWFTERTWYHF